MKMVGDERIIPNMSGPVVPSIVLRAQLHLLPLFQGEGPKIQAQSAKRASKVEGTGRVDGVGRD